MAYDAPQSHPSTAGADDPTKVRWLIVGAALLLQFSIGAVYA